MIRILIIQPMKYRLRFDTSINNSELRIWEGSHPGGKDITVKLFNHIPGTTGLNVHRAMSMIERIDNARRGRVGGNSG